MKSFTDGNIRFSALSEDIFRIEIKDFEDRNTFNIPSRESFFGAETLLRERGGVYYFSVGNLTVSIKKDARDFSSLKVVRNKKTVYNFVNGKNTGELPDVFSTPVIYPLFDSPRLVPALHGYSKESVERGERFIEKRNARDLYLIYADGDYKKLRRLLIALTGVSEMTTLSVLGNIFSKYYPYTQKEATEKIDEFLKKGVPLDTLVIDTDWREPSDLTGGCGYNVNKKLFPDMKEVFDHAHARGVEIIFNDHPIPTKSKKSVFAPEEIVYREENLLKYLEMGLDIWWFDRNWPYEFRYERQLMSKEITGAYIFHDVTERHYKRVYNSETVYKRPVILSNVSEIRNGEYVSIRESASHRYPFQWSGDIKCDLESLSQEIANMIKCSGSMIAYYSSDIGGHVAAPTRDDFIRWYQYGCLSPILRPHSTITAEKTREPWAYDEECFEIVSSFVKMRYALLPTLYKRAFENVSDGLGIISPTEFMFPDDKKTRGDMRSYMIGKSLLVSPVAVCGKKIELGADDYVGKVKASFFDNKTMSGKPVLIKKLDRIGFELADGERLSKRVPAYDFSAVFEAKIKLPHKRKIYVTSDDGVRVYVGGKLVAEDWSDHAARPTFAFEAKPNVVYDIKIEYYQGGGGAQLGLFTYKDLPRENQRYFPKAEWINVFDGKRLTGGRKYFVTCPLRSSPLFVRAGSLIVLSDAPKNAKSGVFDKLILEYYPSKTNLYEDFWYEDDGVTTAYRNGVYKKYRYLVSYSADQKKFVIKLFAGEGGYVPEKRVKAITLKIALTDISCVRAVTINGAGSALETNKKDEKVYPFVSPRFSPCFDTVSVSFERDADREYTIEIFAD